MAATCMAVCKGSRKKIRGIFISSCHLPAAVECDIVILSEPGPNPTGPSWAVLQTQLIPARGRKRGFTSFVLLHIGHNLSPRGDGNRKKRGRGSLPSDTTYPREGTETCESRLRAGETLDTTYPREGTETCSCAGMGSSSCDTTYPREGTETLSSRGSPADHWTQLIPARGRKLGRPANH